MTWQIALFLSVCWLFALAYVGAIAALLGLKIHEAIVRGIRWVRT